MLLRIDTSNEIPLSKEKRLQYLRIQRFFFPVHTQLLTVSSAL